MHQTLDTTKLLWKINAKSNILASARRQNSMPFFRAANDAPEKITISQNNRTESQVQQNLFTNRINNRLQESTPEKQPKQETYKAFYDADLKRFFKEEEIFNKQNSKKKSKLQPHISFYVSHRSVDMRANQPSIQVLW